MGILSDIAAESDYTPEQFLQSKLASNTPFDEFGDYYAEKYKTPRMLARPEYEAKRAQMNRLPEAIAQERASREGETTRRSLARNIITKSLPYGSAIIGLVDSERIKEATNRVNAGTASDSDYAEVARRQVQQEIDDKESTGAAIGKAAFHIPALVGEAGVAGKVIGRLGRAVGYGGKAAPLAQTGQVATGEAIAGTAGQAGVYRMTGAEAIGKVGRHIGKSAAMTPAMPSVYLEQASQNAEKNGGEWYDIPKNLGPAYAMGVGMTAILGTLQGKFGNRVPTMAGRTMAKTLVAAPEQVAVDVLGGISTASDGYGVTGELWKAHSGGTSAEKDRANKHLYVTMATFGMFSAMHARHKPGTPYKPSWMPEFTEYMKEQKKGGATRDEAVQRAATDLFDPINKHIEDYKDLTYRDVKDMAETAPEGSSKRKFLDKYAEEMKPNEKALEEYFDSKLAEIEKSQATEPIQMAARLRAEAKAITDDLASNPDMRTWDDLRSRRSELLAEAKQLELSAPISNRTPPEERAKLWEEFKSQVMERRSVKPEPTEPVPTETKATDPRVDEFIAEQRRRGFEVTPEKAEEFLGIKKAPTEEQPVAPVEDVKKPDGMSDALFNLFRNDPTLGRQVDPETALMQDNPFAKSKTAVPDPRVEEAAKQPEQPVGTVRVYHGGLDSTSGGTAGTDKPTWVTGSLKNAEGWAARDPKHVLHYADIPLDHPEVKRQLDAIEHSIGKRDPIGLQFELPGELSHLLKSTKQPEQTAMPETAPAQTEASSKPVAHPRLKEVHDAIDAQADLPPEMKVEYKDSMTRLHESLPPAAVEAMHANAPKIRFFKDKKGIQDAVTTELTAWAKEKGLDLNKVLDDNFKALNNVGMYRSSRGELWLNGGGSQSAKSPIFTGEHAATGKAFEIHAHEAGHAVDGKKKFSGTPEWLAVTKEFEGGKLSKYAEQPTFGAHESFAEFFRLVHGSEVPLKVIEAKFPLATKFFKDNGLWSTGRKSNPTVSKMPEVFDTRIPVGEDHVDAKMGAAPDKKKSARFTPQTAEQKAANRAERLAKIADYERQAAELQAKIEQLPGDVVSNAEHKAMLEKIAEIERQNAIDDTPVVNDGETYADYIHGKDKLGTIGLTGELADVVGGRNPKEVRDNILEMVDTQTPEGKSLRRRLEKMMPLTPKGVSGRRSVSLEELAPTMVESGDMVVPPGKNPVRHLIELIAGGKPMETSDAVYAQRENAKYLEEQKEIRDFNESPRDPPIEDDVIADAKGPMPEDTYFSKGSRLPDDPNVPQSETRSVSPYEVNAAIDNIPGVTTYIAGTAPYSATGKKAAAVTLQQTGAAVVGKEWAADPLVRMEEAAHISTNTKGILTPEIEKNLPADVREGLHEFDALMHGRTRTGLVEGIGQWAVRRMAGQLDPARLSKNQKAAAVWAENAFQEKGLIEHYDRIGELYRASKIGNPIEQVSKLMGHTPATDPTLPLGTKVAEAINTAKDDLIRSVENDLHDLWRMREAARKAGHSTAAHDRAIKVFEYFRRSGASEYAGRFATEGYFNPLTGKHTSKGDDFIFANLRPEDTEIARGTWWDKVKGGWHNPNKVSKFSAFMLTRHILDVVRKENMIAKQNNRAPVYPVPDEHIKGYQEAMRYFEQDPAFMARAIEAHDRVTKHVFNDSLDLLVDVGWITPQRAKALKEHPKLELYIPLIRVKEDGTPSNPNSINTGRKGTSGEMIQDPMISIGQRRLVVAEAVIKQIKDTALADMINRPEMGEFAVLGPKGELTEQGRVKAELLKTLRETDPGMAAEIEALGTADDYVRMPWTDTGKNLYAYREGGELRNIMFADKNFYNLVTDRTMEANTVARLMALGHGLSWRGIAPFKGITSTTRFLSTAANLAFQVKNVPRDMFEFFQNTLSRASVKDLPAAYAQMYWIELANLVKNQTGFTLPWQNPTAKRFIEERGRSMKKLSFERRDPVGSTYGKNVTRWGGLWNFAKDVLNVTSAGEMGPRFVEFKNKLKQLGHDPAKVEKMFEKDPHGNHLPFDDWMAAMNAANEVTVPFDRMGSVTREWNQIKPFFGPAVAGISKSLRNWKSNPKGALYAMGAMLGLRMLHYLMVRDEDWYKDLEGEKFDFVVKVNDKLYVLPGPRDLHVPVGAFSIASIEAADNRDPQFRKAFDASIKAMLPPGVSEGTVALSKGDLVGSAVDYSTSLGGPAAETIGDLAMNKSWAGRPIVPRRDEDLPDSEKLTRYRLPYVASQLTSSRSNIASSLVNGDGLQAKDVQKLLIGGSFAREVKPQKSVSDLYERVKELEQMSKQAKSRGRVLTQDQKDEQRRLSQAADKITDLFREARGEVLDSKGVLLSKKKVSDEEKRAIEAQQLKIAREALGRR